ncbi:MAG: hypothetical protein NT060_00880 [Candidatus Omnitrophica bacterium]|nr:hypothetical protein [Candidatus Omnitrophota bacterium]
MGVLLFTKSTTAAFMITLAVGDVICVLANKEKGFLRKAGMVIGAGIIISSILLVSCKIAWRLKTACDVYQGTYSAQRLR